jgi:DNA-binding CsgD family transcriptional regulator
MFTMGLAIADSFQLLDSRMFSRVLNIYVADSAQNFIAATLALLGADRLCDFSVALTRRPAGNSFVAYSSHNQTWDSAFVQSQVTILRAIRSQMVPEQNVLVTPPSAESHTPEILERYRHEILERMGSTHAALLFLGENGGSLSMFISVHRTGGAAAFDSVELARLDTFRRYIENAWSLLTQRLLSRVLIDGISLALRNYDYGIVMLDSRLRVVWHNRAARGSVLSWTEAGRGELKPGRQLAPLPDDIVAACEKLRAEWLESPTLARLRRCHTVRHGSKGGYWASVRLYGVRFTGITSPNFMVQFEQPSPGPASATPSIMHSLTSSEREVAKLVRQGLSNQEIANALGKSVDAVKFHLHRMFKKADVTTRSRLMLVLT